MIKFHHLASPSTKINQAIALSSLGKHIASVRYGKLDNSVPGADQFLVTFCQFGQKYSRPFFVLGLS